MNTLEYEDSEVYDSLRRLEHVLNNRAETFTNKVESLIEVWKLVQDCRLTEHKQYVMHLMDWLKLHTLNIVLTGDWKKYKDVYEERLLKEVKHCEMLLLHCNNIFSFRCKKLAEVIKDPWGSPILGRLLNTPDLEIGPEEMEFFGMETGYLISTRLRKLCESHCEDLALNLVTAFMRFHQMAEVQHFTINATEDQKRFILDVYIALLYKYKRTHLIISTLKSLTLPEGLDLLKRFAHKRVNISKIWRHSGRIAYLAAQVYMTAAVMKIPSDSARILEGLLDTWLDMPETVEDLVTLTATVRRIMQAADSPIHMYIFCKAFYKRFGGEMRTFIIELYIMALTTDINVLQRQKEEFNEAEERESSERLAYGFLKLADVLDHNLKLSRESVLTAFSLKPSQVILDRIESLAKATCDDVIPSSHLWKCDHPPSDSSDDVSYKCTKCGEYKSYLELKSSLNSNTTLSDAVSEELDLSPHLRDDLVVVLSSPRYHFLNWLGTWKNLYHLCVIYLSDPVKTKNIITELKYVDIDYSLFVGIKREPEDENANGIERGYEHYLEDNYLEAGVSSDEHLSQDNCANEMASGNFHLLPPPATKSDPNVLKSLRLFRPNLKRSKPNQHDQMPPSKVFIPNPYFTSPLSFSPNPFNVTHATSNLSLSSYNNVFTQAASLPHLANLQASYNGKHAYQSSNNPITLQDLQLQAILAASYEQTVRNSLQKDVVLNLSIKDPPTLPMDLSKHNVKENLSEIHKNYVSTAVTNYMRNKSVTMAHKKIVASNTSKAKISSVTQANNINKLIRPSVKNNTLTHQDYSYLTPTSSNYDDPVLTNSKNAGPSMQVFKNKNINYDKIVSKNVSTPTNTLGSSPKNSPVKKRSQKQHSSSGKSVSKSLLPAMEYSVARKIPRTFSAHSSSEEDTNGINFTNPNSAQHTLSKYLNNKPGFSKNSNELRSSPEAILHEEMKALRRATQSNPATSPSIIDPLNSEEFQITLESLLEVKKNPVLMALEEKRRSLEQYKLLFDDFNCGNPFEPHSSRYPSTTFDRMSEDCGLGEDDDKWFSIYNSDEGSTSHVNEPINVPHLSYSPPDFFYTSSINTNSINNSDTILIESSPENSCDKEYHTQNKGRLSDYKVDDFATKTDDLNVSSENVSDTDRCGSYLSICQNLFDKSKESSPSEKQETEEIIGLSSSQQQETTDVSPFHTNSQLKGVSTPLLHGTVEPIINNDRFPDIPKKHNYSVYGLPFDIFKENIRYYANTSIEERRAVHRASLAAPKPCSSSNQDNRDFPINTQNINEVAVINSSQSTCSTDILYINLPMDCQESSNFQSPLNSNEGNSLDSCINSNSSPVSSQGSNSEYEINSHKEMQSRSNSSNRNSSYGSQDNNSDEERNSSNDSLDSKSSEEKDMATGSDNRGISNDERQCPTNTHSSNSLRDSVDTKASGEKDRKTSSDNESSSTHGKKSPKNSSRDSQQANTNTSIHNMSRTNSNADVENSPTPDSSTNDSNSVNENFDTSSHNSNKYDEGSSSRDFEETDLNEQKNVSTSSRDIKSADGRNSNEAPNTLNSTSDEENFPSSQYSSCDKGSYSSMDVEVGNSFEERHSFTFEGSPLDEGRILFACSNSNGSYDKEYFPVSPGGSNFGEGQDSPVSLSKSYSRYGPGRYDSDCCHSPINSTENDYYVEEQYTMARSMSLERYGASDYLPSTVQRGYFEDKNEKTKFKQTQDPEKNNSMCLGSQHHNKKVDSSISPIVNRSLKLKCPLTCPIHYRIKETEALTLEKGNDSTLMTAFSDTASVTDKKSSKNSDHDISRHAFPKESNSQRSIDDNNGYEGTNNKKGSSLSSNGSHTCKVWPGVKVRSLDLGELFLMEVDVPRGNIPKENENLLRKGSVNDSEHELSTSSAESVKDGLLLETSNKRKVNKNVRHKPWETISSSSEDEQLCQIDSGSNKSNNCISNGKESKVEMLSPSSCSSDNTPCDNKKLKDERKIPNWCQILKNLPFVNSIQNFDDNFINFCGDDIKRYKSKHPDNAKSYSDLTNNFGEPCSSESSESLDKRSNWRGTNYRKKKVSKSHPIIKESTKSSQTSLRKFGKVQEKNKNEFDLIKKYKLKEVRVVLHPLTYPDPKQDGIKRKEARSSKQKSKSGPKKMTKKSENLTKEKCRSKNGIGISNSESKPWPLQDISPKVNRYKDVKNNIEPQEKPDVNLKTGINVMNPRVVLKRLEFDKDKRRSASSVLAQVPGLNDLQMIRPSSVDRIVQVVQVPGARSVNNIPIPNTQTSTQITPHIQRIGQPRTEKPLPSDSEMVVATTTATTSLITSNTTTESPTLINILSQQIVRPGNQNNCVNTKPRTSPLINILSQQIIKPAATVTNSKVTSSPSTTEMQVNSIPRVISGGDQIINQLINQVRTPAPTLKTLVSSPGTDQNRIVQFICKSSDGKLIPVTSFTSNKVVKVSMAQTANASVSGTVGTEENSGKVAQNAFKSKSETSEGSDTLPKFQQAFGKPTYQNNVETSESTGSNNETVNSETEKPTNLKNQPKNSSASLNVQPVQGGVIYTRQVPVGQTINLIPPGRGQVFRIATSNPEQLSLVKDSVIQGKMSALLAAALQGKQRTLENSEADVNSEDDTQASTRVTLTARSPLIQNTRIVKPVLQIPSNVIRSTPQSNLSSTTLEQLREFDMVYKQVKERSSTNAPTESSSQSDSNDAPQQISVTYLNQGQKINCSPVVVVSSYCNVQPAASPSLSVTSQGSSSPCVTPAPTLILSSKAPPTKNPKAKPVKTTTTHTTKASPIPKPQQKPQEDEHTTQRIFDILAEYAEQLRNSPDLNNKPAPRRRSNPPTNPNQNTKRKKSSSSKKTGQSSNSLTSDGDIEDTHTVGSEDSSCGIVQISVQDDEQALTTVNTSENSEASASPKQLILTDSTANQSHSLIIADSNVGEALKMSNTAVLVPGNYIMPVSMVKGGQQIAVVSGGSKILATVPARSGPNMLLFQSFLNQSRKHALPTVKYSTIQPLSGISRSMPSISPPATIVPATSSQNLTTVTLSPSVGFQKVNQMGRVEVNTFDTTEVYLAISQPQDVKLTSQQNEESTTPNATVKSEGSYEDTKQISDSSITTSAIAQATDTVKEEISDVQSTSPVSMMALNLNTSDNDKDTTLKVEGRVQSVLVTGTSNGPMLSHNPPTYKQVHSINSISESNKDEYLRNDGKHNSGETKSLSNSTVYPYHNKMRKSHGSSQRLDRELHQLTVQRKAAIERELRLQKSLSEECEDLGVDEPSASDLFPEADLPFDSNHSPSYDQSSQDLVKRIPCIQEVKEETRTIGLFCDDEPLRTDFLFEPIEYQPTSVDLSYDHSKEIRNGQGSLTGLTNSSSLTCEDNTLLQTCTTMSDVTIPSPISPEPYADLSPLTFNKRKYSYSNRKKLERIKQPENWSTELSSSEDTTGSSELISTVTRSPDPFSTKRDHHLNCDDELYEFAIVERLPLKDDQACENIDCEAVADCPSGRGCRRSVKKTCSCCNLTLKVARKRPASRPTTPIKKTVPAKKR